MAALPDGTLVMTARRFLRRHGKPDRAIAKPTSCRSRVPGRRRHLGDVHGNRPTDTEGKYCRLPRNLSVEADGSVTMVRALRNDCGQRRWRTQPPDCQLQDGGETWSYSEV